MSAHFHLLQHWRLNSLVRERLSLLPLVAWLEPSPPGLQTTAPLPALRCLLNPAEASGGVTTRNSDALLELCVAHSARYFSLPLRLLSVFCRPCFSLARFFFVSIWLSKEVTLVEDDLSFVCLLFP